jgi:hypothetical protein
MKKKVQTDLVNPFDTDVRSNICFFKTTTIRQMLLQLEFLSVRQRISYNTLVLLFKIERGLLPEYLCCNLNQVHNMHTHNTRGGSDFTLPYFRRAFT